MNVYVDSSVVLRLIFGEKVRLREWRDIEQPVASTLLVVECFRALDRLRISGRSSEALIPYYEALHASVQRINGIALTQIVLDRAADSFPVTLKTLDAIHLATAILWRESKSSELLFATHDRTLALAARAFGFRVLGV
jgi:predicted nucleic acid-binding protein